MTDRARIGSPLGMRLGVLVLCLSLALAGCSSSAKHSATSSSASAAAGAIDAASKAAITKAYTIFFLESSPEAESLASLQHGALFKAVIDEQSKSAQAQSASAKVTSIRLLRPKVAEVIFTIYLGTQPALPNTKGKAVLEDGKWKVAAETFCALLQLEGTAPPACKDPKVTALP